MTRKRFKKLLMSYGYSRNEAEWMVEHSKALGINHQTYCNVLVRWIRLVNGTWKSCLKGDLNEL